MATLSKIAVCLVLLSSLAWAQTTYYISTSDGDNSNNGTSSATPWQTTDTLQTLSAGFFQPGDSILLKRGDTFWGSCVFTAAGSAESPIVLGAYGTGDRPILNGNIIDTLGDGRAWTAVDGREGYYYKFSNAITTGSRMYQIVDGTPTIFKSVKDVGDQNNREAWLDTLDAGEFGPNGWTDTVWVHFYGNESFDADSVIFSLSYGVSLNTGSHDFVIRDLEVRNFGNQGVLLWGDSVGTVRNLYISNIFQKAIQVGSESYGVLIDSCNFDSTGTTSLYIITSDNCTARYDTITNVQATIRGVSVGGDQQGIGIQGRTSGNPGDGIQGMGTVIEYCHVEDAIGGLVDFYYNYGDTIRYNTGTNCAGIIPHGTGLVIDHNTITLKDNVTESLVAYNTAVSDSIIYMTNNRIENVTETGIGVAVNSLSSTGPVVIYGNTIIGTEADVYLDWFSRPDSVTSYNNKFYGLGIWRVGTYLDPADYETLGALQDATDFEDGSTWAAEEPTGGRSTSRIITIIRK